LPESLPSAAIAVSAAKIEPACYAGSRADATAIRGCGCRRPGWSSAAAVRGRNALGPRQNGMRE
jgi:hypothetical protein